MGFAAAYLQKHAVQEPWNRQIRQSPDPQIQSIVVIPATNESGLHRCLDSLFICKPAAAPAEVIVLINSPSDTPSSSTAVPGKSREDKGQETPSPSLIRRNREIRDAAVDWVREHRREDLVFHILLTEGLPAKHYGAGLARKLVMDEAVRRFDLLDRPDGIILSLDADTVVREDYLEEVTALFAREPETDGCSIRFRHPVSQCEYQKLFAPLSTPFRDPQAVFDAIVNYELHQRYYLQSVRHTGYPWAFHTVGSCFAVRASAYCRQGGMSKRQAGEDFYFIQKVAMQGRYTECNTTEVYPSPRPSDRVPFGTGPDIARQLDTLHPHKKPDQEPGTATAQSSPKPVSPPPPPPAGPSAKPNEFASTARAGSGSPIPYPTYHPQLFGHLKKFYALIPEYYKTGDMTAVQDRLHPMLQQYLAGNRFAEALEEICRNTATERAFRHRFFRKFNMFWLLKYLHFAEAEGVEKMEVTDAALQMLEASSVPVQATPPDCRPDKRTWIQASDGPVPATPPDRRPDKRTLLQIYREYFG